MLGYSFWYGRWNEESIDSLESAVTALRNGAWEGDDNSGDVKDKKRRPVYIDGANFVSNPLYEHAAVRLLQALTAASSCTTCRKERMKVAPPAAAAKTLIFRNADCRPETVAVLRDALTALNGNSQHLLEHLRLSDLRDRNNNDENNGPPIVVPLPPSMAKSNVLTELWISKCRLDTAGCHVLKNMLARDNKNKNSSSSLRRLTLQDISFVTSTNNGGDDSERMSMMSELLDAVACNVSLAEFYIEAMHLDSAHAAAIARMISKNRNLSKLSLRKNSLDASSIQVLCEQGLHYNHGKLQTLYLSHNPVGDAGARHLVALLQQHQSDSRVCQLQELCLVQSQIGSAGCLCIAAGLATFSRNMRRLSLDGNTLHGPAVAAAFLKSLERSNMTMEQLVECPQHLQKNGGNRQQSSDLWKQIDVYLRWNKAQRCALDREPQPAATVFSEILQKTSDEPDVLYQFLRHLPCLTTTTFACNSDGAVSHEDYSGANVLPRAVTTIPTAGTPPSRAEWKATQLAAAVTVREPISNQLAPSAAKPFPLRQRHVQRTPPCA